MTAEANPQLLLLFTEPVVGLKTGSFNVTLQPVAAEGDSKLAAVHTVQPAADASTGAGTTAFTLQLALPPAYIGGVNVTLQVRMKAAMGVPSAVPTASTSGLVTCQMLTFELLLVQRQEPVLDTAQQVNVPVAPQSILKLTNTDFVFGALPPTAFSGALL